MMARVRKSARRFIAVEGPIGAGKSTLARILADAVGARLVEEKPEDNPFLGPFYRDPPRHALSVQLWYLLQRYAQQADLAQGDLFAQGGVVADYLFAKDRLFATLNLSTDELSLYDRIYRRWRRGRWRPTWWSTCKRAPRCCSSASPAAAGARRRPSPPTTSAGWPRPTPSSSSTTMTARLLIVNASDIDIVSSAEDRRALIDVIRRTRSGINHWSRS